jgi:proton glutamate symport protein
VEGLAFIAGIDRLLRYTVVNVIENSLGAIEISKSEGQFNEEEKEA